MNCLSTSTEKHIIKLLNNYYFKHINPTLVLGDYNYVFRQNMKIYKNLFINKMKICIIEHLQILRLFFYMNNSVLPIADITHKFCYKFHNKIQDYLKTDSTLKHNTSSISPHILSLNTEILMQYLIREITFCISPQFAFYDYIK